MGHPPRKVDWGRKDSGLKHLTIALAVYSKYEYEPEKRAALDLWADRLRAIVGSGAAAVVPLRKRR